MAISDIQKRHSEAHYQEGGGGDHDLSQIVAGLLKAYRPNPHTVLDIGGGDGFLLHQFRDATARHAIDIAPESIRRMREQGIDACAVDLDTEPLPYRDQTFDAVTCVEVLEHLADPGRVLLETRRVLKDDGVVVVSVPNIYQPATLLLYWADIPPINSARYGHVHFRDFTKRVLCRALRENGLEPIKIRGNRIFPLNDPVSRWFAKCFPRWSHHLIACCRKAPLPKSPGA